MPWNELPPGWSEDVTVRNDKNFKVYIENETGRKFYSKPQVRRYLQSVNVNMEADKQNKAREKMDKLHELLSGWTKEVKMRKYAGGFVKDTFYNDPVSGYSFRSKKDVMRYLKSGNIRSCAMRPIKRDTSTIVTPSTVTKDIQDADVEASSGLTISEEQINRDSSLPLNSTATGPHKLTTSTGDEANASEDFFHGKSLVTDPERNKAPGLQEKVLQQATETGNKIKQSSLEDVLSDPCYKFAINTLKGKIPIEVASLGITSSGLPTFNVSGFSPSNIEPNHSHLPFLGPRVDAINIHDLSQKSVPPNFNASSGLQKISTPPMYQHCVPSNYSTFPFLQNFTPFMNNHSVDQSSNQSLFSSIFNSQEGTSIFPNENAGTSLPSFSQNIVPQDFYPVLNSNPMSGQSSYQWSHSVIPPGRESFVLPGVNMASLSPKNVPSNVGPVLNSDSLDQSSSFFSQFLNVVDAANVTAPRNDPPSQPSSST